jgi:hypothetical protein
MRRREFLQAGALGCVGMASPAQPVRRNCILLMLVGGPSHLDTWDLKPDAPSEYRGPFRSIRTKVPGMEISEIFPRMARHADQFTLIRSVYHDGPSFHDAGHQLMQTGRLFGEDGLEHPHPGSVVSMLQGGESVVLPFAIGSTGGNMPHGQDAGYLGAGYAPRVVGAAGFDFRGETEATSASYGSSLFGQSCLMARRLVESGTRFVTVNMFETVFGETTWDIHGSSPFSPISCYRDHVGPMFDQAYSALLEDLHQRGMLENTLVVAMGEFGRTPKINPQEGRDHYPQAWSAVLAGGGIRGGSAYGQTDAEGAKVIDKPMTIPNLFATMTTLLGINPDKTVVTRIGRPIGVTEDGVAVKELML